MTSILQLERQASGSIPFMNNLLFDNTLYSSGGISYDPITGEMTITEEGQYSVQWWIATQTAQSSTGVAFSINDGAIQITSGHSPLRNGELFGNYVFEVTTVPATVSLRNTSTGEVFLSGNNPVKASIIIIKEDAAVTPGGSGTIIPFSSGPSVLLNTTIGGLVGNPAIVSFGNNSLFPSILTNTIDLTGFNDYTFIVPRDGTITSLSAFFALTSAVTISLGSTVNVKCQLYSASPASNTLTYLSGSDVILTPGFAGLLNIGEFCYGIEDNLNIPVIAGTRLALIFSIDTSGIGIITSITGTASAGLLIE